MGNQKSVEKIQTNNLAKSFESNRLNKSIAKIDQPQDTESSQIFQPNYEQMDECSPYQKFDVRILATKIQASNIKAKTIQRQNKQKLLSPKSCTRKRKNKGHTQLKYQTCTYIKLRKKAALIYLKSQKQNDIDSIFSCFMDLTPQLFKKITGKNFYKIRQQPIFNFYQMIQKIGQGSFGSVYKGRCIKTGELRAIKILKKRIMNDQDEDSLISQINILKKMDHIIIIKLYDVFFFRNFFYVVTQFCEGGSQLEVLQMRKIKSQKDIIILMKQICSAVCYMHQNNILHRDLKLDNIVLVKQMKKSQKPNIKLINFGLAIQIKNQNMNKLEVAGTTSYMAPQNFSGFCSHYSDVWSCGIILTSTFIIGNHFVCYTKNSLIARKLSQNIRQQLAQVFQKLDIDSSGVIQKQELKKLYSLVSGTPTSQIDGLIAKIDQNKSGKIDFQQFLICMTDNQMIRNNNYLNQAFDFFDGDKTGYIQKKQLLMCLEDCEQNDIVNIIKDIDCDGDGKISREEFVKYLMSISQQFFLQQNIALFYSQLIED